MHITHPIGAFIVEKDSVQLDKAFDIDESLEIAEKPALVSPTILKELRNPLYKIQLIAIATAITKKHIASSVNEDVIIGQTVNAIEELDRVINTVMKRLREWYGYYYPELRSDDHEVFLKAVLETTSIDTLMGGTFKDVDLNSMLQFARVGQGLYAERARLLAYLEDSMKSYCPNVAALAGPMIGAKLLEKAGSLRKLSALPSSTVQLLGAEKALFRHLRNKRIRPPKHGFILNHQFVLLARRQDRGSHARKLAAKISIAAKVDYFRGEFIGDELRRKLEN